MYFFLLTNYLKYVVFDETFEVLDRLKKHNNKNKKGAALSKQPLNNILFSKQQTALTSIKLLPGRFSLLYVCFALLFLPLALVHLGP